MTPRKPPRSIRPNQWCAKSFSDPGTGFFDQCDGFLGFVSRIEADHCRIFSANYLCYEKCEVDSGISNRLCDCMPEPRAVVTFYQQGWNSRDTQAIRKCGIGEFLSSNRKQFNRGLLFLARITVGHHDLKIRTAFRKRSKRSSKRSWFVFRFLSPKLDIFYGQSHGRSSEKLDSSPAEEFQR